LDCCSRHHFGGRSSRCHGCSFHSCCGYQRKCKKG